MRKKYLSFFVKKNSPGPRCGPRRRGFLRDEDGVTAIEFALVATPFFMMMMAIIEVGLLFFATVNLENGAAVAARQIRTGQLMLSGGGQGEFRTAVCDGIKALLSCDTDKLLIDVRTFDQFGDVSLEDHLADGDLGDDMQFNPGTAEDIVLVRIFYLWEPTTPYFGDILKTSGQDYQLLNINMAFRNEPYIF